MTWKSAVAAASALGLVTLLARFVMGGPLSAPSPADIVKAQRELVPPRGADDRAPMPAGKRVGGLGVVEPADRETRVAAPVAGRIAAVLVKEGDVVEHGAPLIELDSSVEKAALAAAEADVGAARAELARASHGLRREDVDAADAEAQAARSRADLSAGSAQRVEALAKTGASTPDELDRARRQAQTDEQTARAADARKRAARAGSRHEDVELARARLASASARRDQARASLDRLTVRAPIAGEVLQLKLRAGEYATPGGPDPLVILGDTRRLRARIDIDERDIALVKQGAPAFVSADAFAGQRFGGKVVQVSRRMGRKNVRTDDPTERIDTKILEVVIELEQPTGLVPGLRVAGYVEPG